MSSKSIVITGASGGIGAALAEELAGRGHRLTLAARRVDVLAAVVGRCGKQAVGVPADVSRRDDVGRVCDAAIARWSGVDVWVNNAGQGIDRAALELTDDDLDTVLRANLYSALYGMQAIAPHFIERGTGHIVNVSSILSKSPYAVRRSIYSAAKAALNSITANVRDDLLDLAPGARVSLVVPGPVTTGFARHSVHATPDALPSPAAVPAQTAKEVALAMADLIEAVDPVRELFTSTAVTAMARRIALESASGAAPA